MRRIFMTIMSLLLFLDGAFSIACTTAIISGRFTKDGRPLLLKVRDTEDLQNKLMFFSDGKYEYIGLVNSIDLTEKSVWAGCNSAGFAIMNSASYNLNISDTTALPDKCGILMKRALQTCATLKDFEDLVKIFKQPIGLQANFGVIDAKGGVAYYEIGNNKFAKFDANNPMIAPFGYIIRTNYSYSGERKEDRGLIRYVTAEDLFKTAYSTNNLSFQFLLKDVSRCLKHSLTGINLSEYIPINSNSPVFVNYQDFIPNYYSASSFVVQGVRENESPSLCTIWTILGFPPCSIVIPAWVIGGKDIPSVLQADSTGNAPLCTMAFKLKEKVFPLSNGYSHNYINLAVLMNRNNDGIVQKLALLENQIINKTEHEVKRWRATGIMKEEVLQLYQNVDLEVRTFYKINFGL